MALLTSLSVQPWVFVDSEGTVEEVKGPGARGDT